MTQKTQETYNEYLINGKVDKILELFQETAEPIENTNLLTKTLVRLTNNEKYYNAKILLDILGIKLEYTNKSFDNLIKLSKAIPNPSIIFECFLEEGKANQFIHFADKTGLKPDFATLQDAMQKTYKIQLSDKEFEEFEFMNKLSGIRIKEELAGELVNKYVKGIVEDKFLASDLERLMKATGAKPKEEQVKETYTKLMNEKIVKVNYDIFPDLQYTRQHKDLECNINFVYIETALELKKITGVAISEELIDKKYKELIDDYNLKYNEKVEALKSLNNIVEIKPKTESITYLLYHLLSDNQLKLFKELKDKFNIELEPEFYTEVYRSLTARLKVGTLMDLKEYSGIDFEPGLFKNALDKLIKDQKFYEARAFSQQTGETPDLNPIRNKMQDVYTELLIKGDFHTIDWLKTNSGISIENETIKETYKKVFWGEKNLKGKSVIINEIEKYSGIPINYQELFTELSAIHPQ